MISSSNPALDSAKMSAKTKLNSLRREVNKSTSWTEAISMMRKPTVTTVIGIFPTAAAKFVAAPPHVEHQA